MTISTNNNFFNQITSNIAKKNITSTNNDSFKIYKESQTEITAFTKKVEDDFSTYTAKELSELSYEEVQENYEEIKRRLEYSIKKAQDILNSDSFKNYQKELIRNGDYEIRGGSKEHQVRMEINIEETTTQIVSLGSKYNISKPTIEKAYENINIKEYNELQDLLSFNDKFKIVNFFENDEINKTIYNNYEDNSQVYYEQPHISDLDGANFGFNAGSAYNIQGTDLKAILQSVKDAKEFIERHGVKTVKSDGSFSNGYLINGDEISIAGKRFSIYDVNKNIKEDNEYKTIKEKESSTKIEEKIIDYSLYNTAQLREISFEEAKGNYDELKTTLEDLLKNSNNLNKEDQDNLLAFKAQLEKVNYSDNDKLNETIYNKLSDIEDSKVAVWSDLVITENIQNIQDGKISSLILNGISFSKDEIGKTNNINEKNKEEKNKENTTQIGEKHINIDYIINTVSLAVSNTQNTQDKPYSKEHIKIYSDFISQYNQIKDSIF
ncbi:hypothetical protein CP965_05260 [Halarcobacter mediterraneus]|uniref:Uncharacterized protein n=1 Tax=Halarcobacter mediterraneus TaxID=2023153 RepID=A0A4Q1AWK3_9BACT|nr:hypothetical protein [Halarcobacter mediterraneus]RXK13208.1 hypothetical protein CP965_05260 [Halarcobacter mediterraneus]